VDAVAAEVRAKYGVKDIDYMFGTMIEIPRAALAAGVIARTAEFFSFGTNDLTQMGFGFSRDDIGGFVPDYLAKNILPADPFQILDQDGIGELISIGIERGRRTRPNLKVGICGEHGGEPSSVEFCHRVGMDYVSCSPFRVPIARLAAAQAAVREARAGGKVKKAAVRPAGKKPIKAVKRAKPAKPVKRAKTAPAKPAAVKKAVGKTKPSGAVKKAAPKRAGAAKPAAKKITTKKTQVKKPAKTVSSSKKPLKKKGVKK